MNTKKSHFNFYLKTVIGLIMVLIIIGIGATAYYFRHKQVAVTKTPAVNYNVLIKDNPNDQTQTDVYLQDPQTAQESFFITLTDIYQGHYHGTEYHNGNLYIIRRTGGDTGYETNPNWTDELWRYGQDKQGQKLYSVRGLDFRVSTDEKLITIITNDEFDLLDNSGAKIKTFPSNEVQINPDKSPMFGFLGWGLNSIWLDNTFGPTLAGAVKIDTQNFKVTKYDLSGLKTGVEFAINPSKEELVLSDYPAIFDADTAKKFEQDKTKVSLTVYNLQTKTQRLIATATAKKFAPKWLDQNTLEYNDPSGTGRLTKQIP